MNDYISRKWLLDVVENIIKWDTERDRNRIIHQVRELTPAVDVWPVRWIPVTERLPEDFQKVLVFWREHSEPMIDTAFWQKDAKRFDGEHWVRLEEKITHWMPLPESPKEVPGHE